MFELLFKRMVLSILPLIVLALVVLLADYFRRRKAAHGFGPRARA
jgi:hypothetical protein